MDLAESKPSAFIVPASRRNGLSVIDAAWLGGHADTSGPDLRRHDMDCEDSGSLHGARRRIHVVGTLIGGAGDRGLSENPVGAKVERRLECVVESHAISDDRRAAEATAHGLSGAWMRPGADLMFVACQELIARNVVEAVWVTADACDPCPPMFLAASDALGVASVVRPAW